jgi:ABC-type transport system involved in multi-copper enzyme maturation permease subunit
MSEVYFLALRQMAGKWRLSAMTVLSALPVLVTWLTLRSKGAPGIQEFETVALSGLLAGSILPLVVLAIAASAFANELEDRTLANLALAPIPRSRIVWPKLLGSITIAGPFILVSAILTAHIAFLVDTRATIAVAFGAVGGVALYAAAFTWLGLYTTQAIGVGLLYIVVWEGFVSGFVSGVRMLSIRHYTMGLMHAIDPRRFAGSDVMQAMAAVAVSVAVFTGFVVLAIRRLRRMDIP